MSRPLFWRERRPLDRCKGARGFRFFYAFLLFLDVSLFWVSAVPWFGSFHLQLGFKEPLDVRPVLCSVPPTRAAFSFFFFSCSLFPFGLGGFTTPSFSLPLLALPKAACGLLVLISRFAIPSWLLSPKPVLAPYDQYPRCGRRKGTQPLFQTAPDPAVPISRASHERALPFFLPLRRLVVVA